MGFPELLNIISGPRIVRHLSNLLWGERSNKLKLSYRGSNQKAFDCRFSRGCIPVAFLFSLTPVIWRPLFYTVKIARSQTPEGWSENVNVCFLITLSYLLPRLSPRCVRSIKG